MRKAILCTFTSLIVGLSLNCIAMMRYHPQGYDKDMQYKINLYKNYSYRHIEPALKRVGLPYPPKKLAILVFKHSKRLELWAKDKGPWKHVLNYNVLAASGGPGPKLLQGDHQVPEGIYDIAEFNPNSHFDLSMELSYPNAFDRAHARADQRTGLGGDIFIHGNNRSIGCVAIGNDHIEQLFVLAALVGRKNIEVIVAPNDLRTEKPIYAAHYPNWLPGLYAKIKHALVPFKLPQSKTA